MGNLIVNGIDLNDPVVVDNLRKVIDKLAQIPSCYYPLRFKPLYYFEVPTGRVPSESGWYIILEGKKPLYAGKADDLNKRLNTNNGSIDNFANKGRSFDPERNFIKKFLAFKSDGKANNSDVGADFISALNKGAYKMPPYKLLRLPDPSQG